MTSNDSRLLPVGTIIAYAGTPPASIPGWLLCDGSHFADTEWPELSAAIGTAYGSPAAGRFNVPALCGQFLRAVAGGANTDPERDQRVESRPGGATGDRIGSAQPYGTAAPTTQAFGATLPRGAVSSARDDDGCATAPGAWSEWKQPVGTSAGGDLESRPVNKAVWWLIKSRMKVGSRYVCLPVGGVVALAATQPDRIDGKYWLFCNGDAVTTTGLYAPLHQAIQYDHGRAGDDTMVLPDYRGWFLRGVDADTGVDPDAARREAPYPMATDPAWRGNTGDRVGSRQGYATGLPRNPLVTDVWNLPRSDASKRIAGAVVDLAGSFGGSTTIDLTATGGDRETRPVNLAVDWYLGKETPDGIDADDHVPVGALLMLGAPPPAGADEVFLRCDGDGGGQRLLKASDYPQLHAVIGNLYGGDPEAGTFALPDGRGRFLRGADHGTGVDPDADTRVFRSTDDKPPEVGTAGSYQAYATARPVARGLTGDVANLPKDTLGSHGVTQTNRTKVDGDLTLPTCRDGGGDGDSRPVNVYAALYIKAKG